MHTATVETRQAGTLVYFSTKSGNTHRFIERLGLSAQRLPLNREEPTPRVTQPYILVTPTYGGGYAQGAVPGQVIRFLNDEHNRHLIRGVIASGNTNFGEAYGLAGRIIAQKCRYRCFIALNCLAPMTMSPRSAKE